MKKLCSLLFFISSIYFTASGEARSVLPLHKDAMVALAQHTVQNNTAPMSVFGDTVIHRKHKLIAALLAFPLGIFGLHRIYLGTSTGVPFLYIATLGGALGILPFVDFVLILLCKDVNAYAHNPAIFMWTHKKMPKK